MMIRILSLLAILAMQTVELSARCLLHQPACLSSQVFSRVAPPAEPLARSNGRNGVPRPAQTDAVAEGARRVILHVFGSSRADSPAPAEPDAIRYASDVTITRCRCLTDQPRSVNSQASQSNNSGWVGAAPRSVVTGVSPQLPSLGATASGVQHRCGRLVGVELG